jgi:prefoldin subunit 5
MENEVHRDLGKHDAQIEALNREVKHLHEDMGKVMLQLAEIQATLSEAKGGWRTLMWVAGFSAAIGGFFVKALSWLNVFPK